MSGAPFGGLATQKLQQGSSAALVNRSLGYDSVGNLTSLVDQVSAETLGFSYDEQDRLTGGSGPAVDTYLYTQIGNISSKNGTTYSDDANHPHAVSTPGACVYDANGNMTTRGTQTIKYDPENRPLGVLVGSQFVAKFAYDGDGTRRKRLDANGVIHYAGAYELNNNVNGGAQITKYYTATLGKVTRLIAFSKGGTLFYVGTDHLGGTIKVSDANFAPLDQMRYYAFGQSRDAGTNLGTDHLFTSQIQDASIGLYWFKSRAYDPAVGRFCAPDTVVPDATNPQALNRYSYNINNPLRYVDPTGHWFWFAAAFLAGAAVGYGAQVYGNLEGGMSFDAALTTNIRAEPILTGGVVALTAVLAAPAVLAAAGDGLAGIGLAAGSTSLFAAGQSVAGSSEAVAEKVTGVASYNQVNGRLLGYMDQSVQNVSARGVNALTGPQQNALIGAPYLYPPFRGSAIHAGFVDLVRSDSSLYPRLDLAQSFVRSPDVVDSLSNRWWDVTTPGQWQAHLASYTAQFGDDAWPLLYK